MCSTCDFKVYNLNIIDMEATQDIILARGRVHTQTLNVANISVYTLTIRSFQNKDEGQAIMNSRNLRVFLRQSRWNQ